MEDLRESIAATQHDYWRNYLDTWAETCKKQPGAADFFRALAQKAIDVQSSGVKPTELIERLNATAEGLQKSVNHASFSNETFVRVIAPALLLADLRDAVVAIQSSLSSKTVCDTDVATSVAVAAEPTSVATTEREQRLGAALKYARRFLNERDHDVEFVDAVIKGE